MGPSECLGDVTNARTRAAYRGKHTIGAPRAKAPLRDRGRPKPLPRRERPPGGPTARTGPWHSYSGGSYILFVEPGLIGNLDVVSVRVADVGREVVGTPFRPKARFLDGPGTRVHRRL